MWWGIGFGLGIPLYCVMAGFTRTIFHNNPPHDRGSCKNWDTAPNCWLYVGAIWPFILIGILAVYFTQLGVELESQRPVHRKKRKAELAKRDLRQVHGNQ